MTTFSSSRFPILFRTPNRTRGLANDIRGIDAVALCREYEQLRKVAPSRAARNKRYFVGHDGRAQAKNPDSPSEKHLAIALWRSKARWPRAGGGCMCLLDYQFPLKARSTDAGLGEVDLLGATHGGRLVVIELKVRQKNGSRGDTPLFAVMEGLRYAAVVHANHRAIAAEARDGFAIDVSEEPPIVQVLAPEDWWRGWRDMARSTRAAAGQWEPEFLDLSSRAQVPARNCHRVRVPPGDHSGRRHLARARTESGEDTADASGLPRRYPEYAVGGAAQRQYESAIGSFPVPGLIRRPSWQRLVGAFACAPEFRYLLAALQGKYGIRPV